MFMLIDQTYYLCFPVYYQQVETQTASINRAGSPRVDSFQGRNAVKTGDQTQARILKGNGPLS